MSERTAFKLQNRRCHILSLAIFVGIDTKVRTNDTLDSPHEPKHQVDVMHALVHNRAAAVQFPRAVPADVVTVRAFPFHAEFAQQLSAEGTLLQRGLDTPVVRAVAFSEIDEQFHPVVLAGLDERVAILDANIHRFRGDDVLAAPRRFHAKLAVEPARCHNHRDVNIAPVEHFERVAVAVAAEAFFRVLPAFLNQISDSHELGSSCLMNDASSVHTHAESDNAKT